MDVSWTVGTRARLSLLKCTCWSLWLDTTSLNLNAKKINNNVIYRSIARLSVLAWLALPKFKIIIFKNQAEYVRYFIGAKFSVKLGNVCTITDGRQNTGFI